MTKDYYRILDISEFCTQDDIKCAYRKLARKWHPDVAGNTTDVIAKFKEINEAYEILSDKIKKADYDRARKFYKYAKEGSEETYQKNTVTNENEKNTTRPDNKRQKAEKKEEPKKNYGFNFNWEEFILKTQRYKNTKNEEKSPKRGKDVYSDIEITFVEAIEGTVKIINMLQTQVCPKCGGRKFVNGQECKCCNGKGENTRYKRFTVKIPAGIKNNSKIRLAGEGESGINGGKCGDLYLTVHVIEPNGYSTEGLNVLKTVQITPSEAVFGTMLNVATVKGNVSVKISPNTKSGQKIRLNNCGVEKGNTCGDMILTVEIQIPQNLTNEEIELYKRLQEINSKKL